VSDLGLPKIPHKYGFLNNASDVARDEISAQLKAWGFPLDCNRKDHGRRREQKWHDGESWRRLMAGAGKSPGGPVAMATLALIIARDLQTRGVAAGAGTLETIVEEPATEATAAPAVGFRAGAAVGRGRAAFAARRSAASEPAPSVVYEATAAERRCDPTHLALIRDTFGSRGNTLIGIICAWDAYLRWYRANGSHEVEFLDTNVDAVEQHALRCCQLAIEQQEAFERVSGKAHKSFLPHLAVFKITRDKLRVGDNTKADMSALELLHAEVMRTARQQAPKNKEIRGAYVANNPAKPGAEGAGTHAVRGGGEATMTVSTLKTLLGRKALIAGACPWAMPLSRRGERLMVDGRMTLRRRAVRVESLNDDYRPEEDTVMEAFVRGLRANAVADDAEV